MTWEGQNDCPRRSNLDPLPKFMFVPLDEDEEDEEDYDDGLED